MALGALYSTPQTSRQVSQPAGVGAIATMAVIAVAEPLDWGKTRWHWQKHTRSLTDYSLHDSSMNVFNTVSQTIIGIPNYEQKQNQIADRCIEWMREVTDE